MDSRRLTVLIVLDGWGLSPQREGNAIALASTPTMDRLYKQFPSTYLYTSGEAVGLPVGQMGNSEVGHMSLGSGRVVYQEIMRITKAIESGDFFANPVLVEGMERVQHGRGALHLMGLLSEGGVHSLQSHLEALLAMASRRGLGEVYVHAVFDGRDTPPRSGAEYLARLLHIMAQEGVGKVATLMGRYYAMDRDRRWERVERAYRAMVLGEGRRVTDAAAAIQDSYRQGVGDEFMEPVVLTDGAGTPVGLMRPGDTVVCFNFRADRVRQIMMALADRDFAGFVCPQWVPLHCLCMTDYNLDIPLAVAFPQQQLGNILAHVLAQEGISNLRIAETEKYAHVTFFFNGGQEVKFAGEERILIPSPSVSTYDMKPEMSAYDLTSRIIKEINSQAYQFILLNFANADMVGHSGNLAAAIQAVEAVDGCLGQIVEAVTRQRGALLITADHGNAEKMVDPITGQPHTAHTTNPVPVVLVDHEFKGTLREGGALRDVTPTILGLLRLEVPLEMSGRDLRIPPSPAL